MSPPGQGLTTCPDCPEDSAESCLVFRAAHCFWRSVATGDGVSDTGTQSGAGHIDGAAASLHLSGAAGARTFRPTAKFHAHLTAKLVETHRAVDDEANED